MRTTHPKRNCSCSSSSSIMSTAAFEPIIDAAVPDIKVPICVLFDMAVVIVVGGLPLHAVAVAVAAATAVAAVAVNPAVNIAIDVAFDAFVKVVVTDDGMVVVVVAALVVLFPLPPTPLCCINKSCLQLKSRSPATNVPISGGSGLVRNFARRIPGMRVRRVEEKMGN